METKNWIEQNAELIDVLYLRRENEYYLKIYLFDPAPKTGAMDESEESLFCNDLVISVS
jgi:hypothetical protein